jgi:hypothetical protein
MVYSGGPHSARPYSTLPLAGTLTVLSGTNETFSASGRTATFQLQLASSARAFVLVGANATLNDARAVGVGSFTQAGMALAFAIQANPAAAALALSGQAATDLVDFAASSASFALLGGIADFEPPGPGLFGLRGEAAYLGYDLLGGGSSISGGTFSRQRWREMLAEEERRRAEAERRIRDEKLRRRAARRRREHALAEARRRSREYAKAQADAAVAALVAQHAAAARRGVADLKEVAARATAQAHAARLAQATPPINHDEEEAIALLLAHAHR